MACMIDVGKKMGLFSIKDFKQSANLGMVINPLAPKAVNA